MERPRGRRRAGERLAGGRRARRGRPKEREGRHSVRGHFVCSPLRGCRRGMCELRGRAGGRNGSADRKGESETARGEREAWAGSLSRAPALCPHPPSHHHT